MGWSLKGMEKTDTPPSPSYPRPHCHQNPPLANVYLHFGSSYVRMLKMKMKKEI